MSNACPSGAIDEDSIQEWDEPWAEVPERVRMPNGQVYQRYDLQDWLYISQEASDKVQ